MSSVKLFLLLTLFNLSSTQGFCQNVYEPTAATQIQMNLGIPNLNDPANEIWSENCAELSVTVNAYGISWKVDDPCNSIYTSGVEVLLPTSTGYNLVSNVDVAIVKGSKSYPEEPEEENNEALYVLIVYYNLSTNKYYYYPWQYSDGTLVPFSDPIELDYSSIHPDLGQNGIRIDATRSGKFGIVWFLPEFSSIKTIGGEVDFNAIAGPQLYEDGFSNLLIGILPYDGSCPDIAISNEDAVVYYALLDKTSESLVIAAYGYGYAFGNNMFQQSTLTYDPWDELNGHFIGRPRIATPGLKNSDEFLPDDFIVVYQYFDGSESHIRALGIHSSTMFTRNYTDINAVNFDSQLAADGINVSGNDWQRNPCVSYGYDDNGISKIHIAWEGGWDGALGIPGPGTGSSTRPTIVSLSVGLDGIASTGINGDCPPILGRQQTYYTMIPHLSLGNPYDAYFPSIAGKHTYRDNKMIVCWWDDDGNYQDVFETTFNWCDESLRKPIEILSTTDPKSDKNILFPNPSNGIVIIRLNEWQNRESGTIEIFDLMGRKLISFKGTKISLENQVVNGLRSTKPGTYFLRATTAKGNTWIQKVIRQ